MNAITWFGLIVFFVTLLVGWLGGGICFIVGLLVGVIFIIAGGLLSDNKKVQESRLTDRYCPSCGRMIPFDANNCPYCGKQFESFYDKNRYEDESRSLENQ
ncbi:MAG: zinc ribbon domain-containing protein [Candidatus Thermoplasmatota archaeon]